MKISKSLFKLVYLICVYSWCGCNTTDKNLHCANLNLNLILSDVVGVPAGKNASLWPERRVAYSDSIVASEDSFFVHYKSGEVGRYLNTNFDSLVQIKKLNTLTPNLIYEINQKNQKRFIGKDNSVYEYFDTPRRALQITNVAGRCMIFIDQGGKFNNAAIKSFIQLIDVTNDKKEDLFVFYPSGIGNHEIYLQIYNLHN